jgi:MYXO-CTERM domain-containing protein
MGTGGGASGCSCTVVGDTALSASLAQAFVLTAGALIRRRRRRRE